MTRIAVVDDIDEIRNGLIFLINSSNKHQCVKSYSNAEDLLNEIETIDVDLILMDIGLPKMSGIECLKKIKKVRSDLSVLMCTDFEDDEKIFESLCNGASGYVSKNTSLSVITEAIDTVLNGGAYMSPAIAKRVVNLFTINKRNESGLDKLTEREKHTLVLLEKGYPYKLIADELCISIETVRTYTRNIYQKLEVHSRTEAINKINSGSLFHRLFGS